MVRLFFVFDSEMRVYNMHGTRLGGRFGNPVEINVSSNEPFVEA